MGLVSEAEAVLIANATARGAGAVGAAAMVPAFVRRWALPGQSILDYGAGPEARHTAELRAMGFDVTAHDFGRNVRPGIHHPAALWRQYDVVLASNVLNTAATETLLHRTLREITTCTEPGGVALVNLPSNPRKSAWPANRALGNIMLHRLLQTHFGLVQRLPSGFWACKRPHHSAFDSRGVPELAPPLAVPPGDG